LRALLLQARAGYLLVAGIDSNSSSKESRYYITRAKDMAVALSLSFRRENTKYTAAFILYFKNGREHRIFLIICRNMAIGLTNEIMLVARRADGSGRLDGSTVGYILDGFGGLVE
jgi:hypothetical protein